ncbi:MAG: hypothetical protein GEU90_16055 [Gemmatimonas sp.]|nr:hypothetical protein [Gemmatimonas sp.]
MGSRIMIYRYLPAAVALVALSACQETDTPTSALLEQRVVTALGGLEIGESLSLSGEAAAEVVLGGSESAGDFILIPFHASREQGAELAVGLGGTDLGTPGPSQRAPDPRGGWTVPESSLPGWEMHESMLARFRTGAEAARSKLPSGLGPQALANLVPSSDLRGGDLAVDQLVELNTDTDGDFCADLDVRTGRVEAISSGAVVVADVDNPKDGFTRSDYEVFAERFDSLIEPTITGAFGEPTDIDDNGRVVVFFTRAVNELTRPTDEGFVGGFFYSRDLFPDTPADPCPASNQGELFYVLVPDPAAVASHIPHTRDGVFAGALGTIGHEYQHLINASRRIWVNQANSFEETWLDEGLSHIAEELLFYADAGLSRHSNVSLDDIFGSTQLLNAINQFGIQNLIRYGLYLEEVTNDSPTGAGDALGTRGATWAFLRYLADHQPRSDPEFFHDLVNSQDAGFDNLASVVEGDPVDWLQQWGVSVYADDLVTAAADSAFQQPSWDFRSLLPELFGDFPLFVRTLSGSGTLEFDVVSGTSGYVQFRSPANGAAQLSIDSGGETPPAKLRVTVVRTK